MPTTYIPLGRDEHAALIADALSELRPPREHARFLLRLALRERGRLREAEPQGDEQQPASEAANG